MKLSGRMVVLCKVTYCNYSICEFQLERKSHIEPEALSEFGNDPLLFESIADNYGKMGAISKNYEFERGEALLKMGFSN